MSSSVIINRFALYQGTSAGQDWKKTWGLKPGAEILSRHLKSEVRRFDRRHADELKAE
jgi:hypothetical protein